MCVQSHKNRCFLCSFSSMYHHSIRKRCNNGRSRLCDGPNTILNLCNSWRQKVTPSHCHQHYHTLFTEWNLCVLFFCLFCVLTSFLLFYYFFFFRFYVRPLPRSATWLLDFCFAFFSLSIFLLPFWPFASFDRYQHIFSPRLVHIITATAFRHKSIETTKLKAPKKSFANVWSDKI